VTKSLDIDQLVQDLDAWVIPKDSLDSIRSRARESLDEVKGFVDYQDKAASSMLTVVAFLTAAASLVYQRLATDYFWPAAVDTPQHVLTEATYTVFLVYLLLVSISATLVFRALLPAYATPTQQHWLRGGPPNGVPFSALFYPGIRGVTPTQWGRFFTSLRSAGNVGGVDRGTEADELYAKFAIIESYLVADDAAVKVASVNRAGGFLRWSMISLIVFAVLYGLNTVSVRPDRGTTTAAATAKTAAQPTAGAPQSAVPARP
jgi:hypothetical protein